MAIHDFNAQRLFLDHPLIEGGEVALSREQANYLLNVLRLGHGDGVLVFNGRDGEWRAEIELTGKKSCALRLVAETRPQSPPLPVRYMFAPLKRARLDYMVQKAVELGAGRLSPVLTRRTVAERVNLERMKANAVEAAEQCGILSIPTIDMAVNLDRLIAGWDVSEPLVFCDEAAPVSNPLKALSVLGRGLGPVADHSATIGLLIGPEGGFDPAERALLMRQPFVTPISLGPRIMRADTAAVAALALINAAVGDWR